MKGTCFTRKNTKIRILCCLQWLFNAE